MMEVDFRAWSRTGLLAEMTRRARPEWIAADMNRVAAFLAVSDFPHLSLTSATMRAALGEPVADVVALMGSSVLATAEQAFAVVRSGLARRLLISGGTGHSTLFLYESIERHSRYRVMETAGRAEADLLGEIAMRFWDVEPAAILIEDQSRHCGENAAFTLRMLLESELDCRSLLLMQDPTMQRRSAATFAKECADMGMAVRVANHPSFVPRVLWRGGLVFDTAPGAGPAGLWSMERFLALLLGEIPRLRDDADGYGPLGRGFLEHVAMPPAVLAAHQRLAAVFPGLSR
jgi:uncharacterized SAM-binding protein YcdF (DUF218 family)